MDTQDIRSLLNSDTTSVAGVSRSTGIDVKRLHRIRKGSAITHVEYVKLVNWAEWLKRPRVAGAA